jgi:hypothetical protein
MARLGLISRRPINTVNEAIRFLRDYLDIKATGTVFGWHLEDDTDFRLTLEDNAALIEHARHERDVLIGLRGEHR